MHSNNYRFSVLPVMYLGTYRLILERTSAWYPSLDLIHKYAVPVAGGHGDKQLHPQFAREHLA